MKSGQTLWTREQLILAINLYCKLPFGKMHRGNPDVIKLSSLIGRSPSAIARKLGNFASLDPALKARNIGGLPNAGELTEKIWAEFYNNWDSALIESENLLSKLESTTIEKLNHIDLNNLPTKGKERDRLVKVRVNQSIFRTIVLATYDSSCCITGIKNTELLIASHIVPWSIDEKNRLNPTNGVCLNALHDKAFDCGLITISADDYTVKVSSRFKMKDMPQSVIYNFQQIEGTVITLPNKFLPSKEFLKIHNNFFKP